MKGYSKTMKLMISSSPCAFAATRSTGLYTPAPVTPGTVFTMTSIAPILGARSVTQSDTENIIIKSLA